MKTRCAWCDASISVFAAACPHCGTSNPVRRGALGAVAAVAVLLPAIAIAIYAATRWDQPLITADRPADVALPAQPVGGSGDDFNWLTEAMKACDQKASGEPAVLHFLVTPVVFRPAEVEEWRTRALNRIGNAMVLSSEDLLKGLREKTLTIAPDEYTFSIRDGKTQAVRKWARGTGVKWYSAPGGEDVGQISMQYKPNNKGRDDNWGNPIPHQKGNCYWINVAFEE